MSKRLPHLHKHRRTLGLVALVAGLVGNAVGIDTHGVLAQAEHFIHTH